MSVVTLVSGGLDSSLMALLAREEGIQQYPLFIDYGQLAAEREWKACLASHRRLGLPKPVRMELHGFGQIIPSGLTDRSRRLNEDAFLPGRNILFVVVGASYAYSKKASGVLIGLLNDSHRIFPDQSASFIRKSETLIEFALGYSICVLAPLMHLTKGDVLHLVKKWGIIGTYSCHAGKARPCGVCVSCTEIASAGHEGGHC